MEKQFFTSIPIIEEEIQQLSDGIRNVKFSTLNKQNSNQSEISFIKKEEEYKSNIEELKIQIQDINLKISDNLNIFELFSKRNTNVPDREGAIHEIYSLIRNLEQKTFKKFEFVEEKFKKFEDETIKLKLETNNNKINVDQALKSLVYDKENIDFLLLSVEEMKKVLKVQSDSFEENNKIMLQNLEEFLISKHNDLLINGIIPNNNKTDDDINKTDKTDTIKKPAFKIENKSRDFYKRLEHIETIMKTIDINSISNSISKITDTLSSKTNVIETIELKDTVGIIKCLYYSLSIESNCFSQRKSLTNFR